MTIKTIDITAKEWFDKTAGNSYFSARVTINFGMPDQRTLFLPFQYGYGEQYIHASAKELQKQGLIADKDEALVFWRYAEEHEVIMRTTKYSAQRKRDVIAWGRE